LDEGRRRFLTATEHYEIIALDSNACIYYLQGHPHADLVAALIERAVEGSLLIVLSALVQLELLVLPYRVANMAAVRRILQFTEQHEGIATYPITREVVLRTAQIRAATGLNVPDAIVAASASVYGAEAIVGNDRDFQRLNEAGDMRMINRRARLPAFVALDAFVAAGAK